MTLDIRDVSILDALPGWSQYGTVLTIGCGEGRLEMEGMTRLTPFAPEVLATDLHAHDTWPSKPDDSNVTFRHGVDIFRSNTWPEPADVVVCSQVLEHLPEWKIALKNLASLTIRRLIITVPWAKSFNVSGPPPKGHCNYWHTRAEIEEFERLLRPYHVAISRIRTKPEDVQMRQYGWLIVMDKNQRWNTG
jgi:hypothetical protein